MKTATANVSLLKHGDPSRLALETAGWMHLNRYIGLIEGLPAPSEDRPAAAVDRLRMQARAFGTPGALRQLLAREPEALAAERPPAILFGAIVWTVGQLAMPNRAERREAVRQSVGALLDALSPFKAWTRSANGDLVQAVEAEGARLQALHESTGALQHRVESLRTQISQLGFLASRQKRAQLHSSLETAQRELAVTAAEAETRRRSLAQLETIKTEGAWLETGTEDVVEFLTNVWTALGSGKWEQGVEDAARRFAADSSLGA